MHLGNARTALLAWLDARSRNGVMLLRIEDLDRHRCRPEYTELMRQDLRWLGLDWDAETRPQSDRDDAYGQAVDRLAQQARCTSASVRGASSTLSRRRTAPTVSAATPARALT